TLAGLLSGFSYVIAADELTVPAGAATALTNFDPVTPSSVTVMARKINGALNLSIPGSNGASGADGEPGESGIDNSGGGKPVVLPGGAGGPGEDGEAGDPGGKITVRYTESAQIPTGQAPGGIGGAGGKGGPGGPGRPPGRPGRNGRPGANGAAG